jgi:hypothetical protein
VRYLVVIVALGAIAAAALLVDGRRTAPADPRGAAEPAATPEKEVERGVRKAREVRRSRCPDGVADCKAVRGTVVYVERVDPDGDGDLHVVVDAGDVTLAGMTAIDVAPELRPRRDPRVGDRASAAGPVQIGSYGQSQIHALEFHARRP